MAERKALGVGPGWIVNVALVVALAVTALLIVWAQRMPALPWKLAIAKDRVVVAGTSDEVTELRAAGVTAFPIVPADLVEEPDVAGSWAELDAFYARQGELWRRLQGPTVEVRVAGTWREVPVVERGLAELPLAFYTLLGAAIVAWIVGFSTYALSDRGRAARLYVVSAVAFCIAVWPAALYAARPLALVPHPFRLLSTTDHAGGLMFAAGVIAVLAVYPVRLVRTTLPLWAFAVIAAVIGHLQLGDMAISGFYTANAIQFVTFLVFAGWQWRATRKQPLQRAALGWISLSMFVGVIFFLMLITVPVLVGGEPLITQTTGLVSIVFMYAGISLGVLRFRLFDLDRWWFRTWTWLFSGAAVVAVDLVLTRLLQLQHSVALVVALIVVGWVYFPVRQRMVERISRRGVPRALDARALISAASLPELRDELERALASTFTPLEILATDAQLAAPRLAGDGAWLEVPIPTGGTFRCHFRDAGTRLFARDDVARAADLVTLAESVRLAIEARTEGELAERARIRRDLHDDLGASIIRIAQDAPDARTAHLAKLAMRDLRDVLTALHDEPTECMDLLEDLEAELRARAQAEGRDIEWTVHGSRSQVLPARHCANLTRVLRESMTNALRHGTGDVRYVLELDAEGLRIVGTNAVTPAEPGANDRAARPEPGFGLGNIAARMKELGGTASSHRDLDRFRLELSLPWSTDR